MSEVLVELARAAALALLCALPVAVLGGLLTLRLRRRSITAVMIVLVMVPLTAALAGVLGTSGFMYSRQLASTVAVVAVVAVVSVPTGMLLGRRIAREALWQREALESERRSEASRRELVAGLSHDLRSPLAGIRGMTDALVDGVVHRPEEVAEYLGRIGRETARMTGMVEDLFQLSRARSAALQLEPSRLALGEVGSDAVAAEAAAAAGAGVRVEAATPERWPTVLASGPELTRVVRNLVSNAIRHTSDGGVVRMSAGVRDGEAWLAVQDECGGIPDADLARVFEAGYRGSVARTPGGQSGAGLGLAIAKALMDALQGRIEVRNEGTGCRFELALAVARPQPSPRAVGQPR